MVQKQPLGLAEKKLGHPLCDIGTTSLTGLRRSAAPDVSGGQQLVAHPVFQTLPLTASDCATLGSDFARLGLVFPVPEIKDDQFTDPFGVDWLYADCQPAPLNHPLEKAGLAEIAKFQRPVWPRLLQIPERGATQALIVADAPCPGLLDMCFGLRNAWQFMEDISGNWRTASALLDWSLETICGAYEALFDGLNRHPDVVVYGDDLGFQGGMFLSPIDFRNFARPRLRTLMSRLRKLTPAAICFHSCGAIRPILGDIADLGIEILNIDPTAKGMIVSEIRRDLPSGLILHGSTDVAALGAAIGSGNKASVALLAGEFASGMPAIAAPVDSISEAATLDDCVRGLAFLRALSCADLEVLANTGPLRSIIDRALEAATDTPQPVISGAAPPLVTPGGWLQ